MLANNRTQRYGQGFSLIELLVVLVIMAILAAIIVPSLIASQPERNMSAASERFASDLRYCRAKAEATGQNIYLGFIYSPWEGQIDAGLDRATGDPIDQQTVSQISGANYFRNPANPGIGRTCTEYYIVQERPRTMRVSAVLDGNGRPTGVEHKECEPAFNPSNVIVGKNAPVSYIDWLNWYDSWDNGATYANGQPMPYPEEPRFPYRRTQSSVILDPKLGPLNRYTVPLVAYPQYIINGQADYLSNFSNADASSLASPVGGDWSAGDPEDQQFKVFCTADETAILGWDDGALEPGTGLRYFSDASDYDMLDDTVIDYVLLKRIKLPDHVYFINPWRSQWVVGWEDQGPNSRKYVTKTVAFMQHLFQFTAKGKVSLCDWSYAPLELNDGNRDYRSSLYHGSIVTVDNMPTIRPIWLILDECLDFAQPENYTYPGGVYAGQASSEISVLRNAKKANLSANGRMYSLWPANGKFYVDEYVPNDAARRTFIDQYSPQDKDSLFLDMTRYISGNGALDSDTPSGSEMSAGAEELGWAQDFLCAPGTADHIQR